MDVPFVTDRRRGAIGVDLNATIWRRRRPTLRAIASTLGGCRWSPTARTPTRLRPSSATRWPASCSTRKRSASPSSSRSWTSGRRSQLWRASPPVQPDAVVLCLWQDQGLLPVPWLPAGSGDLSGQPGLQFRHRPGEVHGAYGLTVHQAAALVLARRLLGCSERIPRRWVAPIGNGVQVAFTVPVRKRVKHVWTYWGAVSRQLRPALAAQYRLGRPNPVRAVRRVEARGVA